MAAPLTWLVKHDLFRPGFARRSVTRQYWRLAWLRPAGTRYLLLGIMLRALSPQPQHPRPARQRVMQRSLFAFFYLHSWAVRSRACATPLSEKVSVDCVPLADTPLITAFSPPRMASIILASSVAFLIQAPSCCV